MGNHAIMELVLHIMQCLYYYIIIIYYYLIITNGNIITHYYTFQTCELADACGFFCFASEQLLFAFLSCLNHLLSGDLGFVQVKIVLSLTP